MGQEKRVDFCTECRKETEYELKTVERTEFIRDKEYRFCYTTAVCKACGEELTVPGLIDLNIRERDAQYRKAEDIILAEDIEKIMDIYHIGKAPLSLALGFGEITVSRYLDGQMPSKPYSDIMKMALSSPEYMGRLLEKNREKVGETAYRKAQKAVSELKSLFQISEKMRITIAYIFEQMQEVTPLALQKLLYFIQGIYMVIYKQPIYPEDCQAWVHGPVYEKVYLLFKDFKYNPIEDNRFVLFSGKEKQLLPDEKRVIDLVIQTFGKYSGRVLEKITHNEEPWMEARSGLGAEEPSNVTIQKGEMRDYYVKVADRYGVDSVDGLNRYIETQLAC